MSQTELSHNKNNLDRERLGLNIVKPTSLHLSKSPGWKEGLKVNQNISNGLSLEHILSDGS